MQLLWAYILIGVLFTAPANVGEYRVTVNTNHRVDTARVIMQAALQGPWVINNFDSGDMTSAGRVGFGATSFSWNNVTNYTRTDEWYSPTYSMLFRYPATDIAIKSSRESRFSIGKNLTEFWMEWRWFVPANYEHRMNPETGQTNNKMFQIWFDQYASGNPGMQWGGEIWRTSDTESYFSPMATSSTSSFVNHIGTQGTFHLPTGRRFIHASGPVVPGTWTRLRWHFKPSSASGVNDGVYQMWIGDDLYWSATGKDFWSKSVEPIIDPLVKRGYLMGWSNTGFTNETKFYIDDFALYDTNPGWQ